MLNLFSWNSERRLKAKEPTEFNSPNFISISFSKPFILASVFTQLLCKKNTFKWIFKINFHFDKILKH